MYLILFIFFIAVAVIIGGIFSGGVFTIILVPLAVIGVIAAVAYSAYAHAAGIDGTDGAPADNPNSPRDVGSVPPNERHMTPDEYTDALRRNQ
jgi:hypothetical protein